ncbi:hypothetical protein P7K49_013757 [Saguinus oedipus]|uniref:Uncharacterized protein n=1 Tax=Saguinus oedipus TaxID=9490 RepID=A0ABQ9VJT4_SAGOE|nr:hypothetical protein P7K49_013757 [Saguinus oedipus]
MVARQQILFLGDLNNELTPVHGDLQAGHFKEPFPAGVLMFRLQKLENTDAELGVLASVQWGTLLPGTEPTVDTVPVQPIPAYWYYVMAAGGAVLVLVSVALALVLHYHRFRYAAKKTDHSITYKTSHYTNGAPLAVEPTLTIKLEQDRAGSHC